MKRINYILGDAVEIMKRRKEETYDAIITDPPYGWNFMSKDWDRALPSQEAFNQFVRILKPGAFAFIMSGPRLDCLGEISRRLSEARFETGFTPVFHVFAQGFPKAQNIGKTIDKRAKAKRRVSGHYVAPDGVWRSHLDHSSGKEIRNPSTKYGFKTSGYRPLTVPTTLEAKAVDGSYAGFQPKPAVEVIVVAMKPLSEKTYVEQALKDGKGITWLGNIRIPYRSGKDRESAKYGTQMDIRGGNLKSPLGVKARNVLSDLDGRFPANLLVSDDVLNNGEVTKSGQGNVRRLHGMFLEHNLGGAGAAQVSYPDSGSFSRYFSLDAWWKDRIGGLPGSVRKTFPFLIVPKAPSREKWFWCRVCGQAYPVTKRQKHQKHAMHCYDCNVDFDPRAEKDPCSEQYGINKSRVEVGCAPPPGAHKKHRTETNLILHPTQKPLKLITYLLTLACSPRGRVRVLDPYCGTGTTLVAASILNQDGYNIYAEGIDNNDIYLRLAEARTEEAMEAK